MQSKQIEVLSKTPLASNPASTTYKKILARGILARLALAKNDRSRIYFLTAIVNELIGIEDDGDLYDAVFPIEENGKIIGFGNHTEGLIS